MPVLIIDTAFETCQVGILHEMNMLSVERVTSGGQHDRVLATLTDKIFQDTRLDISDIKKIIVTTGPGRFTGLRVGIAFARGLSLVNGTPLAGVWTTDAIAVDFDKAYPAHTNKAVLVAVKRGESFLECRALQTGIISVPDGDLTAYLKKIPNVLVAGVLSPTALDLLGAVNIPVAAEITEPSLDAIASLGLQIQASGPVRPYYAV